MRKPAFTPIHTIIVSAVFMTAVHAGTIKDPALGVDAGSFSAPISTIGNINPSGDNNTGIVGLYNDTGSLITDLTLTAGLTTGLNETTVESAFSCNATNPAVNGAQPVNPFFMNCSVNYDPTSGLLRIRFYGVNPPDGDDGGTDDEINEQEGIPPVPAGCNQSNVDTLPACSVIGHFVLIFNDDFAQPTQNDANNSWTNNTVFGDGPLGGSIPTFNQPTFILTITPEPATWLLMGAGILGFAIQRKRAK